MQKIRSDPSPGIENRVLSAYRLIGEFVSDRDQHACLGKSTPGTRCSSGTGSIVSGLPRDLCHVETVEERFA